MTRNIIAILRGIRLHEIEAITEVLLAQGIDKIEIPLNSLNAFASVERLCHRFANQGLFGAGTVLTVQQVNTLAQCGAQMVVSPHCDPGIISATKAAGMLSYPGVVTASECFTALGAGADGLKFFPGECMTPTGLKAVRAVLPDATECLVVGGVKPDNFQQWHTAGASGFGIGTMLYQAGDPPAAVKAKARAIVQAYDAVVQ